MSFEPNARPNHVLEASESDIQKSILKYLAVKGYYCWRNNTGCFTNSNNHFYQFGKKGSADIIGCAKDGKMIAIEVKRHGKKPTPDQVDFLNNIKERQGYAILAYSLDDVINAGL